MIFDSDGYMNLSSLGDRLMELVKYANALQENIPYNAGMCGQPSLTEEAATALVERVIAKTPVPLPGSKIPLFELLAFEGVLIKGLNDLL